MKKIVGGLFITIAAIIILFAAAYNYGSVPLAGFGTTCSGFNDISLSSVDYLSNDPQLNSNSWVMTVSQNCQGRYAVGSFSKEYIKDLQENAQSENDLKITTSLDEQKCEYPIQVEGKPIMHANYETKDLWLGLGASEFEQECITKPGYIYFAKKFGTFLYTCFWTTETSKHGIIGTPSTTFKSTIRLDSHGETKLATITKTSPGSVKIGDVGFAYWNGNLVTGDQCPIAADYRIDAAYLNGVWKTIDASKYQDYLSYDRNGFENCITRYLDYGTETPESCANTYNIKETSALAGKQLISTGGSIGTTYGREFNGKIILEPTKILQFPLITMRINAEWLGVFIPVGIPDITYASSQPFRTGTKGLINVEVKNIGDYAGSFSVFATCPGTFSQTGSAQYVNLAPGQTITVSVPITASCSKETKEDCQVCAADRNNPDRKDCLAVQATCRPQVVCTPGLRRCNGNYIEQCNTEGTGWSSIQKCEFGCIIQNNVPSCKTQTEPVCGNGICEQGETFVSCSTDCGAEPSDGLPKLDYELIGLVALLGMVALFGAVIYKKRKKKRRF